MNAYRGHVAVIILLCLTPFSISGKWMPVSNDEVVPDVEDYVLDYYGGKIDDDDTPPPPPPRTGAIIRISQPYENEIIDSRDCAFSYDVSNFTSEEGVLKAFINGYEVATFTLFHQTVGVPSLPQGPHEISIRCFDHSGQFLGVSASVSFEVSAFAPPASILPLPPGAYGVLSPPLPAELQSISTIPEQIRPKIFENQQRCLVNSQSSHQSPAQGSARAFTFLIWEPWGIVGFGAQILGMRVGLGLGLNYNRIVVGNPGHEASMVQSELKWRFGHSGKLTSPWGAGALLEYSPCGHLSNVMDSVRPYSEEDFSDTSISNLLTSGDIFGLAFPLKIFTVPQLVDRMLPDLSHVFPRGVVGNDGYNASHPRPGLLFAWWSIASEYLLRPGPELSEYIRQQKEMMGWTHPMIGVHMRMGLDKNREAQRLPVSYYVAEVQRLRTLFGVNNVYVCSDDKKAVVKARQLLEQQGFSVFSQVKVPDIPSAISNFGQAALFLSSALRGLRPSYIAMDDVFEGFRYYGFQIKLVFDETTGLSDIEIYDCNNGESVVESENGGLEQRLSSGAGASGDCLSQVDAMGSGDKRVIGLHIAVQD